MHCATLHIIRVAFSANFEEPYISQMITDIHTILTEYISGFDSATCEASCVLFTWSFHISLALSNQAVQEKLSDQAKLISLPPDF